MNQEEKKEASCCKTLLIIPCYNEAQSIGNLLKDIRHVLPNCDTLVIDDGSKDQTYAIASQLSPCVSLVANLGIGGAVQTGIKYALRNGYDLCIQIDGDGQHPPDQVPRLLKHYNVSSCNLIIGSRFIDKEGFQSSMTRRLGIQIIKRVIQILYRKTINDPTSGLRLMDRKTMKLYSEVYPYDYPEPISVAYALKKGLVVSEVPVRMHNRKTGKSSIGGINTIIYMLRVIGYLVLGRLER